MYFLEKTDCSNSNPPFMTYFEDPDLASFVYTIERHPYYSAFMHFMQRKLNNVTNGYYIFYLLKYFLTCK